jgi:hypothetical protein
MPKIFTSISSSLFSFFSKLQQTALKNQLILTEKRIFWFLLAWIQKNIGTKRIAIKIDKQTIRIYSIIFKPLGSGFTSSQNNYITLLFCPFA